jgi:hypothetical protein
VLGAEHTSTLKGPTHPIYYFCLGAGDQSSWSAAIASTSKV